jgi:hypothetical protein
LLPCSLESLVFLSENKEIKIYTTILLPVVLYRHETLSHKLKEEHRLKIFKNRVFTKIFGSRKNEVTEGWRKMHCKEVHSLYTSPNIIIIIKSRRMIQVVHAACMREMRCIQKFDSNP